MTNAINALWTHAEHQGERVALREGDRSWTYEELRQRIAAYARRLSEAGIEPGERVLLVAPTSMEFVVAYHGLLANGIIAVTVNVLSTQQELEYFAEDADCSLVIGWHESPDAAAGAAKSRGIPFWSLDSDSVDAGQVDLTGLPLQIANDEIAVLLYTSGT